MLNLLVSVSELEILYNLCLKEKNTQVGNRLFTDTTFVAQSWILNFCGSLFPNLHARNGAKYVSVIVEIQRDKNLLFCPSYTEGANEAIDFSLPCFLKGILDKV